MINRRQAISLGIGGAIAAALVPALIGAQETSVQPTDDAGWFEYPSGRSLPPFSRDNSVTMRVTTDGLTGYPRGALIKYFLVDTPLHECHGRDCVLLIDRRKWLARIDKASKGQVRVQMLSGGDAFLANELRAYPLVRA